MLGEILFFAESGGIDPPDAFVPVTRPLAHLPTRPLYPRTRLQQRGGDLERGARECLGIPGDGDEIGRDRAGLGERHADGDSAPGGFGARRDDAQLAPDLRVKGAGAGGRVGGRSAGVFRSAGPPVRRSAGPPMSAPVANRPMRMQAMRVVWLIPNKNRSS